MQRELFDQTADDSGPIPLEEIFEAYFSCRKNKRKTSGALAFEVDYEKNLLTLWRQINNGNYAPGQSSVFIIDKPVKREIFAADFRDRVVHHLVIDKLNPLFEKEFIRDSCSCRVGKGTHYGIRRTEQFLRRCSRNYTRDCHVLKLDISGFFMHIKRDLLFERLRCFVQEHYHRNDRQILINLCRAIIMCDPVKDCRIKGDWRKWRGFPPDKSLFNSPPGCGLPIGNLTSQVFANFYLNEFDHYIKHSLGIRCYVRYVDDFILIDHDRQRLKALISCIRQYLKDNLGLPLHPRKIFLQHYAKGVPFLGVYIKPGRIYIARRTKGNFYQAVGKHNKIVRDHKPNKQERKAFFASVNSYLGIMKHYNTAKFREKIVNGEVDPLWAKSFEISQVEKKITDKAHS